MAHPALLAAPARSLLALGASLLLLPDGGSAQGMAAARFAPRLQIAPFIGWATSTTRVETWSYAGANGAAISEAVETHLAGGLAAGLIVQFPVQSAVSVLGGVTWIDRDDADFSINGGEGWVFTGSTTILAKAGIGLRLPEDADEMTVRRLGAGVFVAPFYMLESPKEIGGIDDSNLFDSASHYGVNFGLTGELPFARDRVAIQAGFEDYLTFWNGESLSRLPDWLHNGPAGTGTSVDADPAHQWLLRLGIGFRL